MSTIQNRPEQAPERASDALGDDQVDAGGGMPQRVLIGGQDMAGPGMVYSPYWPRPHRAWRADPRLDGRMPIVKVLRRLWIPLVVLVVIGCGGFIVSRIHGIFGAEKHPSYVDGQVDGAKASNPKQVIYEVFGPPGTVADISYFDVNSEPQQVDGAPLPWSLKITTTAPSVVGSIVAQGDSNSIGCRIVVDGEVKAERISNEVNAYTHCLVTGA